MRILETVAAPAGNARGLRSRGALLVLFFAMLLALAAPASAQAPAGKRTIIRPGRVLDVRTGELRPNQAILIEGDKIAQVGPAGEVKAAGVDSIEHGHLMDDAAIATLKKNGTYLVPTLFLTEYMQQNMERSDIPEFSKKKMRDVSAAAQQNAKKAFAAGVKVAFGTDAAVYPHGLNAGEFHVYVKLGMTPLAAIQTATINAADLLGWTKQAGTLEPGKFADMIAVDGDPTKDVTTLEHVKFVMKGGTVYKNDYAKH
jgi:imidazolonepropionase-like amidohydrolase